VRTALSPSVLRHIDEGRYELLPSGVYARSYIRAYAGAVGLDPETTLAEIEHLLPGAPDAIAAMHEARALTLFERARRRADRISWRPPQGWSGRSLLQPRWGAAAIDASLLVTVDGFLVMLISWSSGIDVEVLLQQFGLVLAGFCAIPIALYFVLFGGIAGSTLGEHACHLIDPKEDHPLTLPDILRRMVRH
jgi:hypothetical protein